MTAPVILCENYDDLLRLFEALAAVPAPYAQKAARRAEFVERIREANDPRLARLEAIEDALRDPFMDKATAFELLDEMASIQISLEKG